jgi:hypothetical protein
MKSKFVNVRKRIYKKKVELVYKMSNDKKTRNIVEQEPVPKDKRVSIKGEDKRPI